MIAENRRSKMTQILTKLIVMPIKTAILIAAAMRRMVSMKDRI
jgi:hypothetical protein